MLLRSRSTIEVGGQIAVQWLATTVDLPVGNYKKMRNQVGQKES